MARRPIAFGARFTENGRTVRVQANPRDPRRYTVEVSRRGGATRRSDHPTLVDALRDFADAWRSRLH